MNDRPAGPSRRSSGALWATFDGRFARFLLVGVSNTLVSFGVFQGLLRVSPPGALAASLCQFVSYAAGVAWSFYWNGRFTFRSSGPIARQGLRFVVVQAAMAGVSAAGVGLCVRILGWAPTWSWIIVMVPVTLANFLLSRYWVFLPGPPARPDGADPDAGG